MKVYVNCGLSTSHGVDKRVPCVEAVVVQLYDENMDCRSTPADINVNTRAYKKNATHLLNWKVFTLSYVQLEHQRSVYD